jgi:hypothetical protein
MVRSFRKELVALLLGAVTLSASAHHSTAAYDATKVMTLEGTVTEVQWVNPHSYINMMVSGADGSQVKWQILSGTPTLNIRNGWKYDDVKTGDKVTVVVHPARNEDTHSGIMRRITLANGKTILGPREFLAVPVDPTVKADEPPKP